MPFTKGHKLSVGNRGGRRKGYEYEKKQLEKMKRIFNQFLKLVDDLYKQETIPEERLRTLEKKIQVGLKIMDKLHANKQETKLSGEARVILEGIDEF